MLKALQGYHLCDLQFEKNFMQNRAQLFKAQLKGSGQKRPCLLGFFNLCSKVVDFLHVTQHYCIY